MRVTVDPAGRFAIRATTRSAELWTLQRIAFDKRPGWQSARDGPVALLHGALAELVPMTRDVLACVWACDHEAHRPDVENQLFTNMLPKPEGAPHGPNVFAHLPKHIQFERSFRPVAGPHGFPAAHCPYYSYALCEHGRGWDYWRTADEEPLATWHDVPAAGLSTGNGWATWASMRMPGTQVVAHVRENPCNDNVALQLSIATPTDLQLVANMEWIIDGVIASFQSEPDRGQAEAVAALIRSRLCSHGFTHDLAEAQRAAPRLFAPPPFHLSANSKRCSLSPADDLLVAAEIQLTIEPGLNAATLSGALQRVQRID